MSVPSIDGKAAGKAWRMAVDGYQSRYGIKISVVEREKVGSGEFNLDGKDSEVFIGGDMSEFPAAPRGRINADAYAAMVITLRHEMDHVHRFQRSVGILDNYCFFNTLHNPGLYKETYYRNPLEIAADRAAVLGFPEWFAASFRGGEKLGEYLALRYMNRRKCDMNMMDKVHPGMFMDMADVARAFDAADNLCRSEPVFYGQAREFTGKIQRCECNSDNVAAMSAGDLCWQAAGKLDMEDVRREVLASGDYLSSCRKAVALSLVTDPEILNGFPVLKAQGISPEAEFPGMFAGTAAAGKMENVHSIANMEGVDGDMDHKDEMRLRFGERSLQAVDEALMGACREHNVDYDSLGPDAAVRFLESHAGEAAGTLKESSNGKPYGDFQYGEWRKADLTEGFLGVMTARQAAEILDEAVCERRLPKGAAGTFVDGVAIHLSEAKILGEDSSLMAAVEKVYEEAGVQMPFSESELSADLGRVHPGIQWAFEKDFLDEAYIESSVDKFLEDHPLGQKDLDALSGDIQEEAEAAPGKTWRERIPARLLAADQAAVLEAAVIGGFRPEDFGYPEDAPEADYKSLYDGLTIAACHIGERLEEAREKGMKRFPRRELVPILEDGLSDAFGVPVAEGTAERFLKRHPEVLPDLVKDPHLAAMPSLKYLEGYLEQSDNGVPDYKASRVSRAEVERAAVKCFVEPGKVLDGKSSAFALDTGGGVKAVCVGHAGEGFSAFLLDKSGEGIGALYTPGQPADTARAVRGLKDQWMDKCFSDSVRERHAEAPTVNEYASMRESLSEAVAGPGKYYRQCRLYVEAACPELAKGVVWADIRAAGDLGDGKREAPENPALCHDFYTGKDGRRKEKNLMPYTVEEYDKIMKAADTAGDAPVFYGDLIPKGDALKVDAASVSPSKVPFSRRQHGERVLRSRIMANQQSKYLELEERMDLTKAFGLGKGAFGDLDIQSEVSSDMQYGVDSSDAARLADDMSMDI